MKLQDLRVFATVAKSKNFTSASKELGLSQPAISRQISSLEEKLESQLFIRNPRNVLLTKKGEQLLRKAIEFENWMDFEFMDKTQSHFKIGCIEGFLHYWLLPRFNEKFLSLWANLEIKIDRTKKMLIQLEKGELDACFTTENIQSELITSRVIYEEQYVLISNSEINENKLDQYTWLIYGESDPLIQNSKEVASNRIIQINSLQGISSLINRTKTIAAVPQFFAEELNGIKIKKPNIFKKRKIYLNTLNHKKIPQHLKNLIDIL